MSPLAPAPATVEETCDHLIQYATYRRELDLEQTAHAMRISVEQAHGYERTISQLITALHT
jgi:hypothetical protein